MVDEVFLFLFLFFSFRLLSVLRGHSFFSSPPQRPMTSDFEGFLYQILSITLFSYLSHMLNYLFYKDYETSCSLAPMFALGWSSNGPDEVRLVCIQIFVSMYKLQLFQRQNNAV